jgi:hypothetical protein
VKAGREFPLAPGPLFADRWTRSKHPDFDLDQKSGELAATNKSLAKSNKCRALPPGDAGRALETKAMQELRRQQTTSPMKKPPGYEPGG